MRSSAIERAMCRKSGERAGGGKRLEGTSAYSRFCSPLYFVTAPLGKLGCLFYTA